jgi:hypothetical protein
MKRRIFIFIFLLMIAAFPARADYFFGPGSTGTGSMTYPGIGIPYTADGASWGASFGVGNVTKCFWRDWVKRPSVCRVLSWRRHYAEQHKCIYLRNNKSPNSPQ